MSNTNQVKVPFLGGVATCTAVNGERVHVVVEKSAPVTVNRVPMYFWATVAVNKSANSIEVKFCDWPRFYRADRVFNDDAPEGAKNKARAAVLEAALACAKLSGFMAAGAAEDRRRDIESASGKVSELRRQLYKAEAELAALQAANVDAALGR